MRRAILIVLVVAGCAEDRVPPSTPVVRRDEPAPAPAPEPAPKHHEPPVMDGAPPAPSIDRPPDGALQVEAVRLFDSARKSHDLVVFASEKDRAQAAIEACRSKKAEEVAKLPNPGAGADVGLYLAWGYQPEPTFDSGKVTAEIDSETRKIRIQVPKWTTQKPPGVGMDWKDEDRRTWTFVGCRAKLNLLPAGDYKFEVVEVDGAKSRSLASGSFTLGR